MCLSVQNIHSDKKTLGVAQWPTSVIPATQEGEEGGLQVSLDYLVKPCLK